MNDTDQIGSLVAGAAMELIGTFRQHGHSAEALQAVLSADPVVIATAIGVLASPVTCTVGCPACGQPIEHEHDPAGRTRPARGTEAQ